MADSSVSVISPSNARTHRLGLPGSVLSHGVLLSLLLVLVWQLIMNAALKDAQLAAMSTLDMAAYNLQASLEQFQYLPHILSINEDIGNLLRAPQDTSATSKVNRLLQQLNDKAHTDVVYVLDISGRTLASSNRDTPGSFIGRNYRFRPYFRNAAAGMAGHFYAIGSTTSKPGYFLSAPLWHQGKPIGVVVVKVQLATLENGWRKGGMRIFVTDANGIVFLSAQPAFLYKTSSPLTPQQLNAIRLSKQYAQAPLSPLPVEKIRRTRDYEIVRLLGDSKGGIEKRYLLRQRLIPGQHWTMNLLVDVSPAPRDVAITILATVLAYVLVLQGGYYLVLRAKTIKRELEISGHLRTLNSELERRVFDRTMDLSASNQKLHAEIEQHFHTEKMLRQTRNDLANASKMAALGQMAAGIAHEINQPLAAMRGFTDNTVVLLERQLYQQATTNLQHICGLLDRLARLTSDLKSFSWQHQGQTGSAQLGLVIEETVTLFEARCAREGIQVELTFSETPCVVGCDAFALEQIFSNLISNAIDAMTQSELRRLSIDVSTSDGVAYVTFADTGCGIPPQELNRLLDPFFTTKPRGKGLGLGLAIVSNIVHEAHGSIHLDNNVAGGASVFICLPLITGLQESH